MIRGGSLICWLVAFLDNCPSGFMPTEDEAQWMDDMWQTGEDAWEAASEVLASRSED